MAHTVNSYTNTELEQSIIEAVLKGTKYVALVEAWDKRIHNVQFLVAREASSELHGIDEHVESRTEVEGRVHEVVPKLTLFRRPKKVEERWREERLVAPLLAGGKGHSPPKVVYMISSTGRTNLCGAHSTYSWYTAEMRMAGIEATLLYTRLLNSCRNETDITRSCAMKMAVSLRP